MDMFSFVTIKENHRPDNFYIVLLLFQDQDTDEFRATLRMPPNVYFTLLQTLRSSLTKKFTNFRKPVSPETRLALTLRFLSLGDGFRSLSQQFRVGLSTSRRIVMETCRAITAVLGHEYLVTPSTRQEWIDIALNYNRSWNFPHCIGSLDGKHIRIIQPRRSGTYFHNYKSFFSIVLLAIASADYRFIYIDIGAEGKSSDGGTWARSSFYEHLNSIDNPLNIPEPDYINGLQNQIPYFLVGDDAFPLSPNLLKPYPGYNLSLKQKVFNYRLSRSRRIIENTFGILSSRFRIFRQCIELNPNFVEEIVMAACVLHNYLSVNARTNYIPPGAVDIEMDDGTVIPGAWRQEETLSSISRCSQRNWSDYAKETRNNMAKYFISEQGSVPWQYEHIA